MVSGSAGSKRLMLLRILLALPLILGGLILGAIANARIPMLVLSLIFALLLSVILHFFSDRILLRWYRAKELNDEHLKRIVSELAMKAGIKTPKLYVIAESTSAHEKSSSRSSNRGARDSCGGGAGAGRGDCREKCCVDCGCAAIPNVFSAGRDAEHASIVMTPALLELLDENELKAVMAHELAHIRRSRGLLISTMIAVSAGMLTALATLAFWISIFTGTGCEDDPAPNAIRLFVLSLVSIPASVLIHLFVPAMREYLADVEGVHMLGGDARDLISAMEKIEHAITSSVPRTAEKVVEIINPAHAHMFFINPLRTETVILLDWHLPSYYTIFNTHPPTYARRSLLSQEKDVKTKEVKTGRSADEEEAVALSGENSKNMRRRKERGGLKIAKHFFYSFISYMLVLFMLIVMDTFNRKDFDFKRSAAIFIAYMFALVTFYIFAVLVLRRNARNADTNPPPLRPAHLIMPDSRS